MITLGIDEPLGIVRVARLVLVMQSELRGMRSQPHVDLHFLLVMESTRVRVGDPWKYRHSAHFDARVDGRHIYDPHMVCLARLPHIQGKAGGTLGVAGMMVRRDHGP